MKLRVLCCAMLLAGCQSTALLPVPAPLAPLAHEHADFGQIYDLASGQAITPAQLVKALGQHSRVLIGEQHDNPDHHAIELWLIRALAQERQHGSVLLEMLTPQQQARVTELQAEVRQGREPEDYLQALAWQRGWDWSQYGPLVRYLTAQPYPLYAANLDREQIMQIYQQAPALEGERSTQAAVQNALREQIKDSHCSMLPAEQMASMLAIQQHRDRRMAQALLAAEQPALLVAGAFHVRKDLGAPLHLADMGSTDQSAVLIIAQAGKRVDPAMADYVWYSAAIPEQDHCSAWRAKGA